MVEVVVAMLLHGDRDHRDHRAVHRPFQGDGLLAPRDRRHRAYLRGRDRAAAHEPSGAGNGTDSTIDEKGTTGVGIYKREWTITASYAEIVCKVSWSDNGVSDSTTLRARRKL